MGLFSFFARLFTKPPVPAPVPETQGSGPECFEPDFPIIPLYIPEEEARALLGRFARVKTEGPGSDRAIAQKVLAAEAGGTRLAIGIWEGRVRFTNYLTPRFNANDREKGKKLGWFLRYYGGRAEFGEPFDTGHMIFWKNPSRKIMLVFGNHLGPVRVLDQDPAHWGGEETEES